MRKFHKVSARLSFSSQYYTGAAEKTMTPFVFMYHEGKSLFLGSKNVLNFVFFLVLFKNMLCLIPSHHIQI